MKRRGMGRVFKRGGACWFSYYGPDPTRPGRRKEYRESAKCACGAAAGECRTAERRLNGRLSEIHGDRFAGPQHERVVIATLLDDYQAQRQLAGKWKSSDRAASQVGRVKEYFGALRSVEITTAGLKTWVNARMAEGYAPATVRQWLATLRAALRLAVKEGRLSRLPSFPSLEVNNAREGFFERDEFEAVVERLQSPLSELARFAYLTGWRVEEIRGLRWENVDRRGGVVSLPTSKNGKARTMPTTEVTDRGAVLNEVGELIERRWKARTVGAKIVPIVFHRKGRPIRSFRKRWATACVAAGFYAVVTDAEGRERKVPTRLFHDLRRTAVRDMVRAGVPETVAMSISGHRTRSIFDRYNITSVTDQRAAMARTSTYRAGLSKKITDISRTTDAASG